MRLYRFEQGLEIAITRDPEGKNLPASGTRWTFLNEMTIHGADVQRLGTSAQDAIQAIEDHGYYILPEKAEAVGAS